MGYLEQYLPTNAHVPDFKNWKWGGEGFGFDMSFSPKRVGALTTTYVMDNGLLARMLAIDGPFRFLKGGWNNLKDSRNVYFIEHSFFINKELQELGDWRINVPNPKGLFLVLGRRFNHVYPAFVMENLSNDFFSLPEKKKEKVLETRDYMVEAAKEHGFVPGVGSDNLNNFLYNKDKDKVYLIGFSTWQRK
ncbi:MAG: hypothetical protein WC812_00755 [Candidatus Pacearchaeota archaeon]|jgi:hypothetical protein